MDNHKKIIIENMIFVVLNIFIVFILVFIYVLRNIQFANLDYQIQILKKEKKKLFEEVEELHVIVADYSKTSRIEKLYREKYGYLPVQTGKKIITLELNEIIVKPK